MALIFDGSANTIAYLAVGGLPDGVVDEDTLATNSVSKVKVKDDAIGVDELHATSGSAGNSTFFRGDGTWQAAGGGKIIKVWHSDHAVSGSTDSTSYVKTSGYIDVTPTSASNKIFVFTKYNQHFRNHSDNETNSSFNVKFVRTSAFDDTTSPTDGPHGRGGIWESELPNGAEWMLGMGALTWMDSPNTTGNRRYAVYYKVADSDWTLYLNYTTTAHELIAYEIADVAAG